jgi:heptosyltransferase-2
MKKIKILIIRFSSFGDILLTQSTVSYLKENIPEVEIHYLVKPEFAEVVELFPEVQKIFLWKNKFNLILDLKKEKYDYIIDLSSKLNSFIIKFFSKAKKIITYKKNHFLRKLIIWKLTKSKIDSVVWSYLNTLKQIQEVNFDYENILKNKKYYPKISLEKNILNEVTNIFNNYNILSGNYLIGIFPGSQHATKQYPVEKYVNFLLEVPNFYKCKFIVFGTWKEKVLALKIRALSGIDVVDLTGAFSFKQLVYAVSLLDLVISGDSAAMHIAASLEKPQIAIFGSTTTALGFRPLSDVATILEYNKKCRPCHLHGRQECPRGHFDCMMKIHSSELFLAFESLFNDVVLENKKSFF